MSVCGCDACILALDLAGQFARLRTHHEGLASLGKRTGDGSYFGHHAVAMGFESARLMVEEKHAEHLARVQRNAVGA